MTGALVLAAALAFAAPQDGAPSAAPALADSAPADGACHAIARGAATDAILEAGPAAPASRTKSPTEGVGFELEVNNDKPEATISWARKSQPCLRTGGPDGATAHYRQTAFSASLSTPIGGKDDLTDPQVIDKLSNGTKLTLGVSRFGFSGSDAGSGYRPGMGWQIGVEASIGYNKFDYRLPGTLAKASDGKVQYGLSAFGALFPSGRSMIGISAEYQHAYKAQDEAVLCKPVVVTPADDCAKAAPGAPKKDDGLPLAVEYRQTIAIGWSFADLALSPKATVDALDGAIGLELPVYLIPKGKAPVLPGVKIGYTSDEKDVSFGVFLKTSFGWGM